MSTSGFLQQISADERGATAIEYGLIVALIVIAMIASLDVFASTAVGMWNDVAQKVDEANNEADG